MLNTDYTLDVTGVLAQPRVALERIQALEQENARLRAELAQKAQVAEQLQFALQVVAAERDAARAELAQVRADWQADAGSMLARIQTAEGERDAARAEAARLREAIKKHNDECAQSCTARDCKPYTARGMTCPNCPRDWTIDAALAGQPAADLTEIVRLRAALTALYEACVLADDSSDLSSTIGGELLDKARAALRRTATIGRCRR